MSFAQPWTETTSASSSREGRGILPLGVRIRDAVALGVAIFTPLLAYGGNLGFAPLIALAGVLVMPLALRRRASSLGAAILLVLLAWSLTSLAWSPAAPHAFARLKDLEAFTGLKLVLQLTLYAAFVFAMRDVSPEGGRRALTVIGVGFCGVLLVLAFEAVRGAELYQSLKGALHQYTRPDWARRNVARATYAIALLIWPVALSFGTRGWAPVSGMILIGAAAMSVLLGVDAPIVAIVAGAGAWGLVRVFGRVGAWLLAGVAICYFALAPVAVILIERILSAQGASQIGKASWGARLEIWRFVTDRISEHPLLGRGLDASRVFPGVVPLHPHDASLQLWLELGAPGALLGALFFGWMFARIADLSVEDRSLAAAAAASGVAYLTIGGLSFGVWQEWWLALGALAFSLILIARRTRSERDARDMEALTPLIER